MINMNKNGDIGSPCLSHLSAFKKPFGEPFIVIENVVVVMHSFISLIQLVLKPRVFITAKRKSNSTQLKAFSMSNFIAIKPFSQISFLGDGKVGGQSMYFL